MQSYSGTKAKGLLTDVLHKANRLGTCLPGCTLKGYRLCSIPSIHSTLVKPQNFQKIHSPEKPKYFIIKKFSNFLIFIIKVLFRDTPLYLVIILFIFGIEDRHLVLYQVTNMFSFFPEFILPIHFYFCYF